MDRVHLRHLGLADQVADGRCADHDLVRGHPPCAVLGLEQRLRDHRRSDSDSMARIMFLFRGREDVDDAVDGLRRGAGVQSAEDQVTGFGGGQRQPDGFQVAHFAHQDDVRVLAQRGAQRVGEAQRVRPDLALVDQALLAFDARTRSGLRS